MKKQLIIPESDVIIAVTEYLKKNNITVTGIFHPIISYTRIKTRKIHHFGGYYINDGEWKDE